MSSNFHSLPLQRVSPEAGNAVALSFAVPPTLRETFAFTPGQFLTLRAQVNGTELRRSYSICSTPQELEANGHLQVGVRAVPGGAFSTWAQNLQAGAQLDVMPPDGRFTVRRPRAVHRVGFAAGSGITPILSIIASTLQSQANAKFTLVYGNRRMDSVMFNEALQDLKDRYPARLTLIHILSRQAQEVPLLQGRIDAAKVRAIVAALLPAASMDEVFICGPEQMIEAATTTLLELGVPERQVHSERFASASYATDSIANNHANTPAIAVNDSKSGAQSIPLTVILDGKRHELTMAAHEHVLDVALEAGLDLPWSCKAGVCCTCRARVMQGQVQMDKNFTLEPDEMARGFVLSCQARPENGEPLVVSYDER